LRDSIKKFKHLLIARYRLYIWRYIAYARLRGFRSFNDWPYHRRGFTECWAAPGFHKFWEIWNPGIAYFVFRIYLKLGGKNNRFSVTALAFVINGIIHTLLFYIISGKYSYTIVILFLLFALITITNRELEHVLQQNKWPRYINGVINITLVCGSFDLSFKFNGLLIKML